MQYLLPWTRHQLAVSLAGIVADNQYKDTAEPSPKPLLNPMTPATTQPSLTSKGQHYTDTHLCQHDPSLDSDPLQDWQIPSQYAYPKPHPLDTRCFIQASQPKPAAGHSLTPVQHFSQESGTFPSMEPILYCVNNPLGAGYATQQYTPAFDIHLPWQVNCQNYYQNPHCFLMATTVQAFTPNMPMLLSDYSQTCHQHHSLLAKYDTSTYNRAFDIHPMLTDHSQQSHQYHTHLPLDTYVQAFAQNKRPP